MGASSSSRRRRERGGHAGVDTTIFVPPTYQQPHGPHVHPGQYPVAPSRHHPPPNQPLGLGPHAHTPYPYPAPPPGLAFYPPAPRPVAPVKNSVHNTSTVRNLVNLKKPTLSLTRVEGKPHLWRVTFKFDATSACCVSVFPMAHEEGRDGKLVSKSPVGPRVPYDKGWNLSFPPENVTDPDLYCIDTSSYPGGQLQHANVSSHSYPLIVRIETLGDSDEAPSGTNLTEMEVGCAQPTWLQSQTTYAVLGEEAGLLVAKVIKQKIWVAGASYELQEIYGLMEASSSAGGDGDTSTECVVCLTNPKNTTVIPCRHFCMCSDCAKALLNQSRKCPMCRLNITSVLQINIGAGPKPPAGK